MLELKPTNLVNALSWEYPNATGTPPSPRESHTASVYVSKEESGGTPYLIIYGGMSGCRLGDLWTLNLGKFKLLTLFSNFKFGDLQICLLSVLVLFNCG